MFRFFKRRNAASYGRQQMMVDHDESIKEFLGSTEPVEVEDQMIDALQDTMGLEDD